MGTKTWIKKRTQSIKLSIKSLALYYLDVFFVMSDVVLFIVRNIRNEDRLRLADLVVVRLVGFKQLGESFGPVFYLHNMNQFITI